MRHTIGDIVTTLWPLLPDLTTGLRFCTALIGLGLAAAAATRRIRRRRPTRLR
jgi:hypothetical protein